MAVSTQGRYGRARPPFDLPLGDSVVVLDEGPAVEGDGLSFTCGLLVDG